MKEQQIQKQIIDYLESLPNSYVIKVISANKSGVPDIHACIQGKWVSVEVKQPGENPTPLQEHHLQQVQKAGGLATWVNSLDQIKLFISQHSLLRET